nr:hypothetical protein [Tanacetum cinerariifolium]
PHNKTPYELLLGRTPSIGFIRQFGCPVTILNTLDPLGNQPNPNASIQEHFDADKAGEGNVQKYVLFYLWSTSSKDPPNTDAATTFEVKETESAVHVSPSSCEKKKKHDDKTKSEAKGKSPVELSTSVRNLSEEFEDFPDNSINRVNAVSTPVPTVGPTLGKYSYVDPSQYPDDPDMPDLEDITYFDDEEDVGAEADFSNLETNITVSPIPTTRVHKDHPVTQIIGMSILGGRKSVPGIIAVKRGKWKDKTTRSLRELHEAIRLFLAYAFFMGFMVYQMDAKSAFLYGTIEEDVYVCQPPGFEDPDYLDKMSSMGELTFFLGLQIKQKQDGIFINQDKYVAEILRKFGLTDGKSASTPIDTEKPLLKDPDDEDVDVH